MKELIERMESDQYSWADKLKAAEEYARELDAEESAHEDTGMSADVYALYNVVESISGTSASAAECQALAEKVVEIYTDPNLAPKLWHKKDGVRKALRQHVRKAAHTMGFKQLKELPIELEQMAIKRLANNDYE